MYDNRLDIFRTRDTGVVLRPPLICPATAHGAPVQMMSMDRINVCLIQVEEIFLCKSIRWQHVLASIFANKTTLLTANFNFAMALYQEAVKINFIVRSFEQHSNNLFECICEACMKSNWVNRTHVKFLVNLYLQLFIPTCIPPCPLRSISEENYD